MPVPKIKELNKALKGHSKLYEIELQDNLNLLNHFTKTRPQTESHLEDLLKTMKGFKFIETLEVTFEMDTIDSKTGKRVSIYKTAFFNGKAKTITKVDDIEPELDGEINIDGYELVRSDRNRHGGGVACYIRSDISFNVRGDFSSEIENIFFDILLPKTKPILIGILYQPPEQSKFLDNLSTSISQTCSFNEQEVYILGDLNINLINSQKHTPNGIKRYKEFCSLHGIEQLLTLPTRITKNSSSLLDHVLTNSADRISQFGIVNVGLSDHQLIYCARKITRTSLNAHKYVKMRSLKYYSEDLYVKKLKEIDFPDYSNFKDINEAYSDFTGKVASVIDEIAPIKEVRVKSNSQDWFDAEINEEIERRDKLLAKFKKSRSHSDNENYKKSRNKVQHMIKDKKKNFVIGKLNDNIGKPKELWKSLKSLGLPSKKSSSATICLEKDGILSFDPKTNAEIFKDFYSNLANNLVKKLPTPQINMEKQQSIITTKN